MKNNAANVIPKMKPNPSSTPQPQPPPPQPPQPQLLQPRPPHPQPLNPPPQPNPQLSHLLKCRKDHNHRLHMHHSIRILNQKMSAVAPVQSIQSFVSHRLFYLNVYSITVFNPNNFFEVTSARIITFLSMHIHSSFPITVIRYVRGQVRLVRMPNYHNCYRKGKYRKRIYKEEKA